MAELADALDLGSSGRPCRFKSCCPYYFSVGSTYLKVLPILSFHQISPNNRFSHFSKVSPKPPSRKWQKIYNPSKFKALQTLQSSRRLTISWLADLSHHRAYGSVHGGSLVFIDYQIIVKHGCISQLGYYFI